MSSVDDGVTSKGCALTCVADPYSGEFAPSTVYRVLKAAGRLDRKHLRQSRKGKGFKHPLKAHELRESMTELDVEIVCQAALEKHPGVTPRIISDNRPQFIAGDFKAFVRHGGMPHVRTSPYYPQSNGKLERWHKSLKSESIRPNSPCKAEEAAKLIKACVRHYNEARLQPRRPNTTRQAIRQKRMERGSSARGLRTAC